MEALSIGQLAAQAGVHIETIRYYERRRLLSKPPRTASGYRLFDGEAVRRLRFIKEAQALGFSLQDVSELLNLRVYQRRSCEQVRVRAEATLTGIRSKIAKLRAMERTLSRFVSACSGRRPMSECRILEALDNRRTIRTPSRRNGSRE